MKSNNLTSKSLETYQNLFTVCLAWFRIATMEIKHNTEPDAGTLDIFYSTGAYVYLLVRVCHM